MLIAAYNPKGAGGCVLKSVAGCGLNERGPPASKTTTGADRVSKVPTESHAKQDAKPPLDIRRSLTLTSIRKGPRNGRIGLA